MILEEDAFDKDATNCIHQWPFSQAASFLFEEAIEKLISLYGKGLNNGETMWKNYLRDALKCKINFIGKKVFYMVYFETVHTLRTPLVNVNSLIVILVYFLVIP